MVVVVTTAKVASPAKSFVVLDMFPVVQMTDRGLEVTVTA